MVIVKKEKRKFKKNATELRFCNRQWGRFLEESIVFVREGNVYLEYCSLSHDSSGREKQNQDFDSEQNEMEGMIVPAQWSRAPVKWVDVPKGFHLSFFVGKKTGTTRKGASCQKKWVHKWRNGRLLLPRHLSLRIGIYCDHGICPCVCLDGSYIGSTVVTDIFVEKKIKEMGKIEPGGKEWIINKRTGQLIYLVEMW